MAIRDFAYTHYNDVDGARNAAPITIKADMSKRPVSINSAKVKSVRKAKSLAKLPCVSVAWYESEDRSLPSVSSF